MALRGLAAVLVALLLASGAAAGDVTRTDRAGDAKSGSLTAAERAALDIVSVRATGQEGLGVVVTVTFRGNVAKLLGRGHLKNGLVALILRPKRAGLAPAGLVTRGTSIENVIRRTRSEQVGAVRNGRTIMFYVGGAGYSNVGRVEVRTLANVRFRSGRVLAAGPPQLSDADFDKIARLDNLDAIVAAADSKQLTCAQLERLNKGVLFYISALVKADFSEGRNPDGDRDLIRLRGFQAAIKTRLDEQCAGLPKTPELQFAWSYFGSSRNEVVGRGSFDELSGRKVLRIRIRVPNHDIDAALCPSQFPKLTFLAKDTIECEGGELTEGVEFTANVRTTPDPERDMGGELTAFLDDGSTIGPFSITGP